MIQYCRYCSWAEDYNGEGTDFLCFADAPCGNNGGGRFYKASKAKSPNRCKEFDFCRIDIFFDENGGHREYHPDSLRVQRQELDQISFFDKEESK
ncbi:MAG: hypothetical protein IJ555_03025 [Ruminococcus sp.]|nr:hypothetical protein [Ruminococcus sp.]